MHTYVCIHTYTHVHRGNLGMDSYRPTGRQGHFIHMCRQESAYVWSISSQPHNK